MKIKPLNDRQDELIESLFKSQMVVGIGSAGTGKTFCTAHVAAEMLIDKEIEKIVLTRPNTPTGKSLGSFPGTADEKMLVWLLPVLNDLQKALGGTKASFMNRIGSSIVLQPLETIRGSSFNNSFIIVDEAQNLTLEEIKAVTTRTGEGSTLALIGDPAQSDVRKGDDLMRFVRMCHRHNIDIPLVQFGVNDIVRSKLVKELVVMFTEEGV